MTPAQQTLEIVETMLRQLFIQREINLAERRRQVRSELEEVDTKIEQTLDEIGAPAKMTSLLSMSSG